MINKSLKVEEDRRCLGTKPCPTLLWNGQYDFKKQVEFHILIDQMGPSCMGMSYEQTHTPGSSNARFEWSFLHW